MVVKVKFDNPTENEIIQRILFSKNYVWGYSRTKEIKYLDDDINDILLYNSDELYAYRSNTSMVGTGYITFNDFIDRMENELNTII